MKQKVEIMSMTDEILSPITKASNVLLEDGSNVQQLIDNYVEPEFTPTIETSSSMSKVGQGDNVDFSANVINGAYDSCVLKGKTLVNYNAEGNDRNEYVCMPSVEGESLTVENSVEGLVKSAILKGQTLNSVIPLDFSGGRLDGEIVDGTWIKLTANGTPRYTFFPISKAPTLKPSTDYILFMEVRRNTISGGANSSQYTVFGSSGAIRNMDGTGNTVEFKTQTIRCRTSEDISSKSWSFDGYLHNSQTSGEVEFRMMFLEYQDGMENWDIPYFTGMQSVKMPVLTTKNKLNSDDIVLTSSSNGGASILTQNGTNLYLRVLNRWGRVIFNFDYEAGKTYNLSFDAEFDNTDSTNWCVDFNQDGGNRTSFSSNNSHFSKDFKPTGENLIQICNIAGNNGCTLKNFVISEVSIKDEPYKSNILSTSEDVTLRGIGDVKDELDLVSGELTQCIGEVVLDRESLPSYFPIEKDRASGYTVFCPQYEKLDIDIVLNNDVSQFVCDKLPNLWNGYGGKKDGKWISLNSIYLIISIPNEELDSFDREGFAKWLDTNPLLIQFKKSIPILKTVDLSDNHVYSYKDVTHYDCSSAEGSLVPTLSIEEGVKYQAIIKPSTKYSIVFNRTVASDSLTVDLGGATANVSSTTTGKTIVQITTLPTLSHNYVKFLGVGNAIKDVQVIEGDVADDVEYFEGMIDVEKPIVTNCNMLDVDSVDYKSNTISTNEVVLRSLPNGVCDTLDLMSGEYVQRVGERVYQEGDENDAMVLTDKVNTRYELAKPIITTIDLKQHPYAYKDGYINLSSNGEKSLTPSIEYSLPINRSGQVTINTQLVQKQQKQLDELESMIIANMVNTQYKQTLSNVEYMLGGE